MTTSKDDPSKWVRVNEHNDMYSDAIKIGQFFEIAVKRHKSPRPAYYYLGIAALMEIHQINQYIQEYMPFGNFDNNDSVSNKVFTPFTLNVEGNVFWRSYEHRENISCIRIEKADLMTETLSTASTLSTYFNVTVTVYIIDGDLEGRASAIYQSVSRLLGFVEHASAARNARKAQQQSFVGCILDINQYLNKHLGLIDISKIVFQYLFV